MNIDVLKKFTPFDCLQDEYLEEALSHIKVEEFKKGDMIFKRGRAIAARFFLLEGQVDLIDRQYSSRSVKGGSQNSMAMLNPESPTPCSCVVKGPIVSILSIDAEVLDRLIAWSESADAAFEAEMEDKQELTFDPSATGQFDVVTVEEELSNDWMSALLKSPLFTRVPLTHVQELFARFKDVELPKGEKVINEGGQGDYFYVLASGSAQITNNMGSVNVEIGPGQHFGEEALLGGTLRNASVTMLEDGSLKRLNAEDFQSLLSEPVLSYTSMATLATLGKPYKLIDVKMPLEYRNFHVKGSINLPLARLRATIPELAVTNAYVVAGDAGSRAKIAAHLLCQSGFDALILSEEGVATAQAS